MRLGRVWIRYVVSVYLTYGIRGHLPYQNNQNNNQGGNVKEWLKCYDNVNRVTSGIAPSTEHRAPKCLRNWVWKDGDSC